jgi:hypothetical protein
MNTPTTSATEAETPRLGEHNGGDYDMRHRSAECPFEIGKDYTTRDGKTTATFKGQHPSCPELVYFQNLKRVFPRWPSGNTWRHGCDQFRDEPADFLPSAVRKPRLAQTLSHLYDALAYDTAPNGSFANAAQAAHFLLTGRRDEPVVKLFDLEGIEAAQQGPAEAIGYVRILVGAHAYAMIHTDTRDLDVQLIHGKSAAESLRVSAAGMREEAAAKTERAALVESAADWLERNPK